MFNVLEPYVLAFIPIFVAVDAIGNIPLFISLTEGISKKQRSRIITDTVTTATVIAIIFMLIGKFVFRVIGITIADFQIAGGLLLFVISVKLLLTAGGKSLASNGHDKDIGVFPLGTPLITGPAVLTTTLITLDTLGPIPTVVSLVVNMIIVWVTLAKADVVINRMGAGGTRAFSKIMYILLAAIAVMMVRKGLMGVMLL